MGVGIDYIAKLPTFAVYALGHIVDQIKVYVQGQGLFARLIGQNIAATSLGMGERKSNCRLTGHFATRTLRMSVQGLRNEDCFAGW